MRVPNQPKTPNHSIRIARAIWEGFAVAAAAQGSDRTTLVDQLMGWFVRAPGAVLPERLSAPELARVLREAADAAPDGTDLERRKKAALYEAAERVVPGDG